jgi:adenine/guanine phosphoribosyltransferase-like PRPP-binding protein
MNKKCEYHGSSHIKQFINPKSLKKHIRNAVKALKEIDKVTPFDTIAFCGVSGCLIGPLLATSLKKEMIVVRKPRDDRHSSYEVEGNADVKNYIIVDDLISSGDTMSHVKSSIERELTKFAICLGGFTLIERTGFLQTEWMR